MEGMGDYLQKKAQQLRLERGDQLKEIQVYLDEQYPGLCRATSLNDGVLKITTHSASVASELRYQKQQLIQYHQHLAIKEIVILIA